MTHILGFIYVYFIVRLLNELPEKNYFPVLDLYRLLILTQSIAVQQVKSNSAILDKIVHWSATFANLGMPTQLMSLRVFCNLFHAGGVDKLNDQGCAYLLQSEERYALVVDMISKSLSSQVEGIRLTAAALACNLALYVPRNGSDQEVQMVSSMLEYLQTEDKDDVIQRMLLAIYRIAQGNATVIEIAKALETTFDNADQKSTQELTKKLLAAVKTVLK